MSIKPQEELFYVIQSIGEQISALKVIVQNDWEEFPITAEQLLDNQELTIRLLKYIAIWAEQVDKMYHEKLGGN
jgi:hypothetical protein